MLSLLDVRLNYALHSLILGRRYRYSDNFLKFGLKKKKKFGDVETRITFYYIVKFQLYEFLASGYDDRTVGAIDLYIYKKLKLFMFIGYSILMYTYNFSRILVNYSTKILDKFSSAQV